VISESPVVVREQVLALERAGVDAVLVGGTVATGELEAILVELTGR
jgi:indole-3-glycerol phosphate synthase